MQFSNASQGASVTGNASKSNTTNFGRTKRQFGNATQFSNASVLPLRDIKTTRGWAWLERQVLDLLDEYYAGERILYAERIYLTLCRISSEKSNAASFTLAVASIAARAHLHPDTVRRYLHEFVLLGLLAIEEHPHAASTYYLLTPTTAEDEQSNQLGEATMVLADRDGYSQAGLPAAQPPCTNASTPLVRGRGKNKPTPCTSASRIKKQDSKENKQTNRDGGGVHDQCALVSAETLPAPDEETLAALLSIQVRSSIATQWAVKASREDVLGWVVYVKQEHSITSPAAFVLSRLKAGEHPPVAKTVTTSVPASWVAAAAASAAYRAQFDAAELSEATTDELSPGATVPVMAATSQPPATWMQEVWQSAQEVLEPVLRDTSEWQDWLAQVRLVGYDGNTWLMWQPSSTIATELATEYDDKVAAICTAIAGEEIHLRFSSAHSGQG